MQIDLENQIDLRALLTAIREPVAADLKALDALILRELYSDIDLIQTITQHIIQAGGKRLRPLVVILCARAAGYAAGTEHLELATIIEFVHTATLLHDDVIDASSLRRGRQTANAIYGNQASVLVGDFLYSRSFQILTRRSHVPIMQVLANTTNAIAEGEIIQLMNCHDADTSEARYYQVIERKTAKLFESACEIGAMLNPDQTLLHSAAATYGLHLGLAFQIMDDILDYAVSSEKMGKNRGDDLAEGKPTLPLIYTLQHASETTQTKIKTSIESGSRDHLDVIIQAMKDCNAFDYCYAEAKKHIDIARASLHQFPDHPAKHALAKLLDFVMMRDY